MKAFSKYATATATKQTVKHGYLSFEGHEFPVSLLMICKCNENSGTEDYSALKI